MGFSSSSPRKKAKETKPPDWMPPYRSGQGAFSAARDDDDGGTAFALAAGAPLGSAMAFGLLGILDSE